MVTLIKTNNAMTTQYYYTILEKALDKAYPEIEVIENIESFKNRDKDHLIMVGYVMDAFRLYCRGYKNIMVWVQGVKPEECLMSEGKKIKAKIQEKIEKYVLKRAKFCVLVSDAMRIHYENKYHIKFNADRYYVMPCFNEETIHKNAFQRKADKFVYTGSISAWQCFEEAMEIYKSIEQQTDGKTSLLVLTPQQEKARERIKAIGIKNYEINYVKKEELEEWLCDARYGFVLRENNTVNNVATPTKFSTYCSYGITPVFTKYVHGFYDRTKELKNIIALQDLDITKGTKQILLDLDREQNLHELEEECLSIFSDYYNSEYHIAQLKRKLENIS